jgi:hypothetical protein
MYGFYTWGTMDLLVAKGSYNPPTASNGITEIKILPDASGNAASVLQQGGRDRKRASFKGYALETDYKLLETDYYAAAERTFTDIDNNSFTAAIESFNADKNGEYYEYSITLVEV